MPISFLWRGKRRWEVIGEPIDPIGDVAGDPRDYWPIDSSDVQAVGGKPHSPIVHAVPRLGKEIQ